MGLNLLGSGCECNKNYARVEERIVEKKVLIKEPDPDPRNFKVLTVKIKGVYAIVSVRYPDCTNYEGNKLLVFEGVTDAEIRTWTFLDPHFCEGNHPTPIARFEPTLKGWALAEAMCKGVEIL